VLASVALFWGVMDAVFFGLAGAELGMSVYGAEFFRADLDMARYSYGSIYLRYVLHC
jgi:hypothetical protein